MGKIVDLALELFEKSAETYDNIKPEKLKFRKLVGNMMLSKNGRVWVVVDDNDELQGYFLGMVTEFFFSNDKYATDVSIYVRDKYLNHAPKMINRFIKWAESKPKVRQVKLGVSSGMATSERTGKFYESMGFDNVGGLYIKRVDA